MSIVHWIWKIQYLGKENPKQSWAKNQAIFVCLPTRRNVISKGMAEFGRKLTFLKGWLWSWRKMCPIKAILCFIRVSFILHTALFDLFRALIAKFALLNTLVLMFALFIKVNSMRRIWRKPLKWKDSRRDICYCLEPVQESRFHDCIENSAIVPCCTVSLFPVNVSIHPNTYSCRNSIKDFVCNTNSHTQIYKYI